MVKRLIAATLAGVMMMNSMSLTTKAEENKKRAWVVDHEAWTEEVVHPGEYKLKTEAWDELIKEAWWEDVKVNATKIVTTDAYTEVIDIPERLQNAWDGMYNYYAPKTNHNAHFCRHCGEIWYQSKDGEYKGEYTEYPYSYLKEKQYTAEDIVENYVNGHCPACGVTDWQDISYVYKYDYHYELETVPAQHEEIEHKATREVIDLGFDETIEAKTEVTDAWVETVEHPEESFVVVEGITVDVVEWYMQCNFCGLNMFDVRDGKAEMCNCYYEQGYSSRRPVYKVVGQKEYPTIYEKNAAWTEYVQHPKVTVEYTPAKVDKVYHPAEYVHHEAEYEWVPEWIEYVEHPEEGHYVDVEGIKGICQMPYPGGDGYLIGIETFENPNNQYRYEMLILDCSLLRDGKDAWIYTTNKCGAYNSNCLWTIWQPEYGYFWTLFRVYDIKGNLVDEKCYGFANAF